MTSSPRSLPNIIFILADDLGYGDLSCYGSTKISTPNIDKIASQGIRFTDAHSSSAVCTPSRYSILTGRYCWRTKLRRGVLWGYSFPLIEPERPTIATLVKKKGYRTAVIGKWHLGLQWPTQNYERLRNPNEKYPNIDFSKPIKGGPTSLGFDYFFGISGSLDMSPYCFIENEHTLGIPSIPKEPLYQQQWEGFMVPGWRDDIVDITFAKKAIEFIRDHNDNFNEQPFFLYLPTASPHRPCDVQPDFVKGKSKAGDRGDMVVLFDWVVGRINDELERLGLNENTLIIVTSDNGARATCFNGKDYGHKSNGPWRGQKADIWEGGHREPLIVRWPKFIKPNIFSNETICLVDFFATFSAILNVSDYADFAEDSFNMLPILFGEKQKKSIRDSLVHHSDKGKFAIREKNWKLIKGLGSGGYTFPARIIPKKGYPKGQLYDLKRDPSETYNLWNEKPEKVDHLLKLLNKIKKKA
jgi:arylsulfatase A-like enzyme